MNTEHLRKSLKTQWLTYYRDNREWLTRLGVWVTCEGKRRPSSSFILAALSTLEPQLVQLLPLIVDLSSNPDRIVMALGLNFTPDEELEWLAQEEQAAASNGRLKMLPSSSNALEMSVQAMSVQARTTRHSEIEVIEPPMYEPVQVAQPSQAQPVQAPSPKADYSPFGTSEVDTPEISTPKDIAPEDTKPDDAAPEVRTSEIGMPEVTAPEVTAPEDTEPLAEASSTEQAVNQPVAPAAEMTASADNASADNASTVPPPIATSSAVIESTRLESTQNDRSPAPSTKPRTKPRGFKPDPNYSKRVADPLARPSSVQDTPSKEAPLTRPSMDSAQLAAGELPKREVDDADEACEGVRRPNSTMRGTRWD